MYTMMHACIADNMFRMYFARFVAKKNWSACTFLAFLADTRDTWFQLYFEQSPNLEHVAFLDSCML